MEQVIAVMGIFPLELFPHQVVKEAPWGDGSKPRESDCLVWDLSSATYQMGGFEQVI